MMEPCCALKYNPEMETCVNEKQIGQSSDKLPAFRWHKSQFLDSIYELFPTIIFGICHAVIKDVAMLCSQILSGNRDVCLGKTGK